ADGLPCPSMAVLFPGSMSFQMVTSGMGDKKWESVDLAGHSGQNGSCRMTPVFNKAFRLHPSW
ncbi:MAG TPA: hypothetical protein VKR26_03990, partial [Terriglobales bacterium]|nr:hypothetical protein [Terriglobales bacterium]